MTYIRHRPRMVRQSVYEDVKALLVDLDWTIDGWSPGSAYDESAVMAMLRMPVHITDYFPVEKIYQGEDVDLNTLAIDQGTPGEPEYYEMGGEDRVQQYLFNFAFFAESDAIALSLYADLSDRYKGVSPNSQESVTLYNWLAATPTSVLDMDVISFEVAKSPEQPAPNRLLWFAQLIVEDYLELDS